MAVTYGSRELVVNGDAETGPVAPDFGTNVAPTGWTTTGTFTGVAYTAGGGGDLNPATSVAVQGGAAYFSGGTSAGLSTASQKIDLAAYGARIDAGRIKLDLTAQLGGFASQNDKALITLNFLDAAGATLSSVTMTGPEAAARAGVSGLQDMELLQQLGLGVRSVEILVTMVRAAGSYNDGYADNISVHLQGLARGQVIVSGSHDYRVEAINASSGISFAGLGDSVAQFNANQFGTAGIALGGRIEGSAQVDTLAIQLQAGTTVNFGGLTFANWSSADVVQLRGEALAEKLVGTDVGDLISMGAGNDTVNGGTGRDTIDGGEGLDRLTGGVGPDVFVLAHRSADRDLIADFVSANDRLMVQVADFPAAAGLTAGSALGSAFLAHGTNLADGAEDRFIYNTSNGTLWFDADGTGAIAGRLIATLVGAPVLSEFDFVLV